MKRWLVVVWLLSILLSGTTSAFAQDDVAVTVWNESGELQFFPDRVSHIVCGSTAGHWEYVEFTTQGGQRLHGWADRIERDFCDSLMWTLPNIPGLVGVEQFGSQCERYDHVYDEDGGDFSGVLDQTICVRYAPEVPVRVAAQIRLEGLDWEPNTATATSRQHMELMENPVLDPLFYGARSTDNPLGGSWGPGGGAVFWWDDTYYRAFQPWGSSTYYIVNGLGDLWKIPATAIALGGGEYEIPLPRDWQTVWRVDPETEEIDGAYIPDAGQPEYPERSLYRNPRAADGQRQWLALYGRPGWETIAASLPETYPDVAVWRMSLVYSADEGLIAVAADAEMQVFLNSRRIYPEAQEEWLLFDFTLADNLSIRSRGELVVSVSDGAVYLADGHFMIGAIIGVSEQPGMVSVWSAPVTFWYDGTGNAFADTVRGFDVQIGVYLPERQYEPPPDPDAPRA